MRVLGKAFKREFAMRNFPSRRLVVEVTRTEQGTPVIRLWEKRARKDGKVEVGLEPLYKSLLIQKSR